MATDQVFQFKADLQAFSDAVGVTVANATRKIALELHNSIVEKTPVDTGRARASWMIQLDSPSEAVPPPGEYGRDNGRTREQQRVLKQLKDEDPYHEIWISSNLEYIEFLENGSSKQAPVGMVAVSLAEQEAAVQFIIEAESARLQG